MISDLRDFSKINNKSLVTKYDLCDFDELLKQIVKKFKRTIPSHKIYRRGKIKTSLNIDSNRINQVLVNLLSNAVKYSPNAKKIIITVEKKVGSGSTFFFTLPLTRDQNPQLTDSLLLSTK